MSNPSNIEICQLELFTKEDELRQRYKDSIVDRIMRVRDEYNWFISNPDAKDRQFVETTMTRHGISSHIAYQDLAVVKALLPNLAKASRDFHRYRFNEMILETYQLAKRRKDTKTMEKAASSYAKYNRVDLEDEKDLPYEQIVVQPFTATSDPSVLGIKPIPDLKERIAHLLDKYRVDNIDIEDVDWEEADLEESSLFIDPNEQGSQDELNIDNYGFGGQESLL